MQDFFRNFFGMPLYLLYLLPVSFGGLIVSVVYDKYYFRKKYNRALQKVYEKFIDETEAKKGNGEE